MSFFRVPYLDKIEFQTSWDNSWYIFQEPTKHIWKCLTPTTPRRNHSKRNICNKKCFLQVLPNPYIRLQ